MNRKGALAVFIALVLAVCLLLGLFIGGSASKEEEEQPDGGGVSDSLESDAPETVSQPPEGPVTLTVFAASATQKALTELGNNYMLSRKDVTIVFNFNSSGTLRSQIQGGANCDIFISSEPSQMDLLDASVNTEGLDFVLEGTRRDLIENPVALAVPDGNPAGITSFGGLAAALDSGSVTLAARGADTSIGVCAQDILEFYGLSAEDLSNAGSLVYGSTTKETAALVSGADADCGIFYQADAFSAGLTVVDTAAAGMCAQAIYPAAVLNASRYEDAARDFLNYLSSDEAAAVFEKAGFAPVGS